MTYQILQEIEQDDALVLTLASQERDHFTHTINKQRYETILSSIPVGRFRDRVTHLLGETNERLEDVNAIIAALTPQMPPAARIAASVSRLRNKGAL